jgi:hypothetical protein
MATRSPTLAALEDEALKRPGDDDLGWFEVLRRYEPVHSRAERLSEEDQRLLVRKFRLFAYFAKHMFAEFRLDDIAGFLIPPNGDIRSRVCLPMLKALMAQAVRKGRRKADFESIERPTHRVDSTCWELRPKAMKDDDVDDIEMALRKAFTIVDGRTAEVQDIEQALRDLYELRQHGVLLVNPPPEASPRPAPRPRTADTIALVCPNPQCRARLRVPAKYAGRRAKCPKCGCVLTLPQAGAG